MPSSSANGITGYFPQSYSGGIALCNDDQAVVAMFRMKDNSTNVKNVTKNLAIFLQFFMFLFPLSYFSTFFFIIYMPIPIIAIDVIVNVTYMNICPVFTPSKMFAVE